MIINISFFKTFLHVNRSVFFQICEVVLEFVMLDVPIFIRRTGTILNSGSSITSRDRVDLPTLQVLKIYNKIPP